MSNYKVGNIFVLKGMKHGKEFQSYAFNYKMKCRITGQYPDKYSRMTNQNKSELEAKRQDLINSLDSYNQLYAEGKFESVADMAIEARKMAVGRKVNGISERTKDNDVRHIKLHLNPFFGQKPVKDITTGDVNLFVNHLADKNKSKKLILHCLSTLNMVFKYAIDKGFIVNNPNNSNSRIQVRGEENQRGGYSEADITKLLRVRTSLYMECFINLATFTGLSANELQGLKWSDVDFDNNQLLVARTVDNKGNEQKTKTSFRKRVLGLPSEFRYKLRAYFRQLNSERFGDTLNDPIFPSEASINDGYNRKPFCQDQMRRILRIICKNAGVEYHGIGGFRKYFNTSLIALVPPHIRKARMGHSKLSNTAETNYTLVDLEQARSSSEADELYRKLR